MRTSDVNKGGGTGAVWPVRCFALLAALSALFVYCFATSGARHYYLGLKAAWGLPMNYSTMMVSACAVGAGFCIGALVLQRYNRGQ